MKETVFLFLIQIWIVGQINGQNDTIEVSANLNYILNVTPLKVVDCDEFSSPKVLIVQVDSILYYNDSLVFMDSSMLKNVRYLIYGDTEKIIYGKSYTFITHIGYSPNHLIVDKVLSSNCFYIKVNKPSVYISSFNSKKRYKPRYLKNIFQRIFLGKDNYEYLNINKTHKVVYYEPKYLGCIDDYENRTQ